MKVLITGATGFIGSHVLDLLLEQGRDVRAFVLPGEDTRALESRGVEVCVCDLGQDEFPASLFEDVDTLYHLAAIYALWLRDRERMFRVNVEGTVNFLSAAMRYGRLKKVVFTSSIAAVGLRPGRQLSDETVSFNLWEFANDYILSKYISELEVQRLVTRLDLPATIVNPAFPFGPKDWRPTPTGETLVHLINGRFPFVLEGGISLVNVEDVARGHLLAEEKGRVGERYILGGHNLDYTELISHVNQLTGLELSTYQVSTRWFQRAGSMMEFVAEHVTKRAPVLTKKSILYTAQYAFFRSDKAKEELGYTLTPLEETLRKTIRWFGENGFFKREVPGWKGLKG